VSLLAKDRRVRSQQQIADKQRSADPQPQEYLIARCYALE